MHLWTDGVVQYMCGGIATYMPSLWRESPHSMIIENTHPAEWLLRGYSRHPKGDGWIRAVGKSRYHARWLGGGKMELHFDKTVRGVHSAAPKTAQLRAEIKRLSLHTPSPHKD